MAYALQHVDRFQELIDQLRDRARRASEKMNEHKVAQENREGGVKRWLRALSDSMG
jgi:hypothetical protein